MKIIQLWVTSLQPKTTDLKGIQILLINLLIYPVSSNLETVNAQESEQTAETRPTSASDQGDVGVQVANAIKQLQAL